MPRPRSLTTADLAAAALAVLDRDGLAALTMRAVATELRMATMALYRYVADREQLETLVVTRVLAAVDVTPPPGRDWREQVTELLDRVRVAVSVHPEAVPLVLRYRQSDLTVLRWMEAMLTVLTAAGFTGRERVLAQRAIVGYLLGFLQNEHYASIAGPGTAALAGLSVDEFPLLTQTAATARTLSVEEEFRGGAGIVLRGLGGHSPGDS
ncbi:TetR/AcrR family transcriptional regulator C-terminal domain-containing protein [Nocardia sp. alder85J]|uniref:TetR/AcrR family transcriptional regulator C-terminal domain-containing protein n=1 Tax=Nocardia sp. alder85J TaxID=2862949 RepID=UPI001CD6D156|nr:TetR/AcrR family transcriptional regulator C-terminal domain-containing protein [Nocardia sp. alder85J]MCX4092335.1 TetR/AcrR family transcriptional regulator C-terminal domain-containing protein [Nocardia sp. alder85J]